MKFISTDFTYKGGKIYGSADNVESPATTVFCLMLSSLFYNWSTVVRLLPCSSNSADSLFPILKQVILDVENCGLLVHLICADNYPLNEKLFKLFSPTHSLETRYHIHLIRHALSFLYLILYTLSKLSETIG